MNIGALIRATSIVLCMLSASAHSSSDFDKYFSKVEVKYGLPKKILKAIATVESELHPWTLNIDGIPVFAKDKVEAVQVLKFAASSHPYGIAYRDKIGNVKSGFYRSSTEAKKAIKRLSDRGLRPMKINGSTINKVNAFNSDLCIMQLNYRYHGKTEFLTANEVFNLNKCIDYAGQFLSSLIERHGLDKGIGCYNGCGKKPEAQRVMKQYISKVKSAWEKL